MYMSVKALGGRAHVPAALVAAMGQGAVEGVDCHIDARRGWRRLERWLAGEVAEVNMSVAEDQCFCMVTGAAPGPL